MTRRRKRVIRSLAGLGVLVLGLVVAAALFPHRMLCVDDGAVQAEVIIVLGGGRGDRTQRAAELYQAGAAPTVLISGRGDDKVSREVLVRAKVPAQHIALESESTTTWENAVFSVARLRAAGQTNAIVVTSWYHSRRALQCFRKAAPEIQFYSRPAYWGYARSEWKRHRVHRYIQSEYLKLCGYWVRHGVMPF
ncbi:MAG: YdcF family protein [Verrucomicrobiae bacterium]|nr:YdcF family protein [Verrucomicrobiae bacterium]